MSIRLVAMDLDGTLLGKDRNISERNQRALLACQEKGILMVIASGRSIESVRELAVGAGLTGPVISSNGTRIDSKPENGDILLNDVFPEADSRWVYRILKESGIYFVCYGHGVMYQNNMDEYGAKRGVRSLKKVQSENDGKVLAVVNDESRMLTEGILDPYKYVAFSPVTEKLAEVKAQLLAEKVPCSISSSWYDNIEIVKKDAGKGKAIRVLREIYGLQKDEVMAFGDNLNDMEMLLEAGTPVCMENGVDELKQVAKIIAPHHDESGVGQVLEKLLLEGKP